MDIVCDLPLLIADYPKIESQAKLLAEELGNDYIWKNIEYREANEEDLERIKAALEDEEVIPTNSDWTVKLGINLYYTANLSKSPLYSKQMPYNPIIYKAFGRNSAGNSPGKQKASGRRTGRQKKIVVAGRWCGRVWMTNQVHPFLAHKRETEQEEAEEHYSPDTDQNPSDEIEIDDSSKIPSKKNSSGIVKKRKKPLGKAKSKRPRYTTMADSNAKADDGSKSSGPTPAKTPKSGRVKHNESKSQRKSSLKDEAGGPSSRLRKRPSKSEEPKDKLASKKQPKKKNAKNNQNSTPALKDDEEYTCDIEGCSMSFSTKQDLALHKRDICPVKGCGKKFFSHKYLVQHRKVHMDDRPLVCPWKGCKMTFKWPWARTEHIRVHTGDRPYICREPGCGQTFRFVSDFSRHKRKTGHSAKKGRR